MKSEENTMHGIYLSLLIRYIVYYYIPKYWLQNIIIKHEKTYSPYSLKS